MFLSIDKGVKGMIDSMIASIQRLATELIAKAVVFRLIWALFPGLGISISGGSGFGTGLLNFITGNLGAPKGSGMFKGIAQANQSEIVGQTTIYGKDLVTVLRRNGT